MVSIPVDLIFSAIIAIILGILINTGSHFLGKNKGNRKENNLHYPTSVSVDPTDYYDEAISSERIRMRKEIIENANRKKTT